MNNKGFTLIELIATIALLSIIAVISFVSISKVLEQSKVNNCESLKMNITSAAKEYISDKRYTYTNNNDKFFYLQELITGKYITSPVKDPFNSDKTINPNKINIVVSLNEDYTANTVTVNVNGSVLDCTNKSIFNNSY